MIVDSVEDRRDRSKKYSFDKIFWSWKQWSRFSYVDEIIDNMKFINRNCNQRQRNWSEKTTVDDCNEDSSHELKNSRKCDQFFKDDWKS